MRAVQGAGRSGRRALCQCLFRTTTCPSTTNCRLIFRKEPCCPTTLSLEMCFAAGGAGFCCSLRCPVKRARVSTQHSGIKNLSLVPHSAHVFVICRKLMSQSIFLPTKGGIVCYLYFDAQMTSHIGTKTNIVLTPTR